MFDLNNLLFQLADLLNLLKTNILSAALFVALLWGIHFVNVLLRYRLNVLGVYPRSVWGLIGIPCFSFLHGSFNHLFFNSIPLIVLTNFMLLSGMQKFIHVSNVLFNIKTYKKNPAIAGFLF